MLAELDAQDLMTWYVRTADDERFLNSEGYWDQARADEIIDFAHRYYVPQFVPAEGFRLLPWQEQWLQILFGYRRHSGQSRWTKALLTVAKKQGKDMLCSILCLHALLKANVPSPIVVSASTTRENARSIFDELANSLRRQPRLAKLLEAKKIKLLPATKIIRCPSRNGEFRAISNDSGNAEGINASLVVANEVHAWESPKLFRTLEYSTVARESSGGGLLVIISTAGHDYGHFLFDLVVKSRNIIQGNDSDTSFFPTVYEAPDDWEHRIDDVDCWRQANPSLGTSFSEESFKRDLESAKKDTASLISFARYRLNRWLAHEHAYVTADLFDKNCQTLTDEYLRQFPAVVAIDASATTDPSSVGICWALPDRHFHVRNHSFVCEAGVRKREQSNMPQYHQFEHAGELTITQGSCIDERALRRHVDELRTRFKVKEVVVDQYNLIPYCADLMADGVTVYRQPQTYKYYTSPMKEFEKALKEGRLSFAPNRMLRWALSNTRVDLDSYGNCRPDRESSRDKIDPTIVSLMSFARVMELTVAQPKSAWSSQGIHFVSL